MAFFRKLLIGVLIACVLIIIIGFFLPRTYQVERQVTIAASDDRIFNLINSVDAMQTWSPWKALDPNLKITYGLTKVGQGASYHWQSEKSGEGSLVISESLPYTKIVTKLDFQDSGKAVGIFTILANDANTSAQVSWQMIGDSGYNIFGRYFGLVLDSLVGPLFADGLGRLKQEAEKQQ